MTIGAKELPILDVPRGCIKKRHMRMPQDAPIMVDDVMLGTTTSNLEIYQLLDHICELWNGIVHGQNMRCSVCSRYLRGGLEYLGEADTYP